MLGNCVSLTVTVNAQVAEMPDKSVAFQATVFTPGGKVEPLGKPPVCVGTMAEQLSAAVTV